LPAAEAESNSDGDALSNPPAPNAEDFSWLDDAKDQPLDFSAFERDGQSAPTPSDARADLGCTTMDVQGPTLRLPKSSEQAAPQASALPAPADDQTAMLEAGSPRAEDLSFESEGPAATPPEAEDDPASAEAIEDEPAFSPIVAEHSVASRTGKKPSSPVGKHADKKGWWPFGGKKQPPAAKPAPASHLAEANPSPPAVEHAGTAEPVSAEAPAADEDEALSQFFKSLK
jgi:hypothetical protein